MVERSALLSLAAASLLMMAAPPASANPPPLDHPDEERGEEKAGGNAIDRAASGPVAADELPDDYEIDAYFWAYALGLDPEAVEDSESGTLAEELAEQFRLRDQLRRGEPFVIVGELRWLERAPPAPAAKPAPVAEPEQPIDGPAESILDQIDERQAQLPMVGELGTTSAATIPAPAETPPESILDYLDSVPPPAAAQDAAKPAANQATPPQIVETRP